MRVCRQSASPTIGNRLCPATCLMASCSLSVPGSHGSYAFLAAIARPSYTQSTAAPAHWLLPYQGRSCRFAPEWHPVSIKRPHTSHSNHAIEGEAEGAHTDCRPHL